MKRTRSSIEVARVSSVFYLGETVFSCKLKRFDFDAFNEMIIPTGLSDGCVSQCIESLAKEYDEVLCKALDKLAPKRTCIRPNAPWYNEEIAEGSNVSGVRLASKLMG